MPISRMASLATQHGAGRHQLTLFNACQQVTYSAQKILGSNMENCFHRIVGLENLECHYIDYTSDYRRGCQS